MIKNPFIRGLLAGLAIAGVMFITYHALGVRKAVSINRQALVELNQRVFVLEQRTARTIE